MAFMIILTAMLAFALSWYCTKVIPLLARHEARLEEQQKKED